MAASGHTWTASFLISVMLGAVGVSGRAADARAFLTDGRAALVLRTGAHRERCAELEAPWLENTQRAPEDGAARLQVRVRPLDPGASQGSVFPGKSLFSFVRRVYRCCQQGGPCRRLKGIQGRLRGGKYHFMDVELSQRHLYTPPPLLVVHPGWWCTSGH